MLEKSRSGVKRPAFVRGTCGGAGSHKNEQKIGGQNVGYLFEDETIKPYACWGLELECAIDVDSRRGNGSKYAMDKNSSLLVLRDILVAIARSVLTPKTIGFMAPWIAQRC
ncbi:hypothetical protein HDU86_001777 [Geranomyces michiganensis]|nr:hypothetical protein HDU86_001777 [Geranomyces michiganensis]